MAGAARPRRRRRLRVAAQPVGFEGSLGVVAAGVAAPRAPNALQLTMLNVAATQAYTAVQNAKLLRALRDADRRKDEFLAVLSHELRNPLAPDRHRDPADAPARRRASPELGILERQTAHLARLVDDLLDVSRITRGKIELRMRPMELSDAVLRAMEMAQPLLEARAHRVEIDGVPRTGLRCRPIRTGWRRSCSTCCRTPPSTAPPGAHIVVRAWRDAQRVALSVKDDGMGIAPDLIERVFDMFVQQEQTIARSEGGLGLGLTIVRSLVEQHGGRVRAQSAGAGQGSEFTIELPAASGETPPRELAPAPPPRCAQRAAACWSSTTTWTRRVRSPRCCELLGHTVQVAHDGRQALADAARFEPEVAFLDIGLPGLDGYDLARALRERSNGRGAAAPGRAHRLRPRNRPRALRRRRLRRPSRQAGRAFEPRARVVRSGPDHDPLARPAGGTKSASLSPWNLRRLKRRADEPRG